MTMKQAIPPSYQASRLSLLQARMGAWLRQFGTGARLFARNPLGMIGLFIILLFAVMAIAHPILIATVWNVPGIEGIEVYDPVVGGDYTIAHPSPPSAAHLLGTDPQGRDILSQLMFSARNEFILGLLAAVIVLVLATLVGTVSAYFGGFTDAFLMRVVDLVLMLPGVSFFVVLSTLWELNFWTLAIVIGLLAGFSGSALIIKSQALTIKVKPYIDAARVAGAGHTRIILSHIVPNVLPLAFLFMMFTVSGAIFSEATLSFLGVLNIRMSWGIMLQTAESWGYLSDFSTWWLAVPAGFAVTLLTGAFYLVGRGMEPIVNPRLRQR